MLEWNYLINPKEDHAARLCSNHRHSIPFVTSPRFCQTPTLHGEMDHYYTYRTHVHMAHEVVNHYLCLINRQYSWQVVRHHVIANH